MSEDSKKLSFLSKLDNILQDNYINNEVARYDFGAVDTVILNNVVHNISNDEHVSFVLHLDELIVEIYREGSLKNSYSLPYCFIDDIHIILEENTHD